MTSPKIPLRGYLPTLDGWRAVAIMLVILYHGKESLTRLVGPRIGPFLPFLESGWIGVDIFFGISGLLITSRLIEEDAAQGRINLKKFYIRRAFRILPPLILFLLTIALLGYFVAVPIQVTDWIRALCFAANYGPPTTSWYIAHTWSLSVEEHFYFLWPLILLLYSNRRAMLIGVCAALLITAWRIMDIHYRIVPAYVGFIPWRTDTRMDSLLFGAVIACLLRHPIWGSRLTHFLSPSATYITLFILVGLQIALGANPHLQHPVHFLQMILIPAVLVGTVSNPTSWLSRLLELDWLRWLGRLSYSLYLWQQLFFVPDGSRVTALRKVQDWPFNFLAVMSFAAASYYLVERPSIKAGHRLARPVTEGRVDLAT